MKGQRKDVKTKTQNEIKTLRTEVETLNKKLAELSEEELAQVVGGSIVPQNNGEKNRPENTIPERDGSKYENPCDVIQAGLLNPLINKMVRAVPDTNTEVDRQTIQEEIER